MHHSIHIAAATTQSVIREPLTTVKAPEDARFRESFAASIRLAAAPNTVAPKTTTPKPTAPKTAGQKQQPEDSNEPQKSNAAPVEVAATVAPSVKSVQPYKVGDDAVTLLDDPAKASKLGKNQASAFGLKSGAIEDKVPLAPSAADCAPPKKAVLTEIAQVGNVVDAPITEAAADVPSTIQVSVAAATPVAVAVKPPEQAAGVRPENRISSDSSTKPRSRGPATSPPIASHDSKKSNAVAAAPIDGASVPLADGAAGLPPPIQVSVAPITPVAVALKPSQQAAVAKPENGVAGDFSTKGRSRGPAASQPVASHEAKQSDATVAVTPVDAKADATPQITTFPNQSTTHEVGHAGIAIEPQSAGLGSATGVHAASPPAASGISRASDVGGGQGHLDGSPQASDLKTLVATPNVLEVGVASGSHGWLRVRAEFGQAGEVAASVVASTTGAAEGLHKELPALSAYLAGERVGVNSLVVNAAEKGAVAQDAVLSNGAGNAAGSQAGAHPRAKEMPSAATRSSGANSSGTGNDADFALAGSSIPVVIHGNGSGGWLSVRV